MRSNAAPTPALAKSRNQYHAYITMLWRYHGHGGRGTTTACPESGSTAPGAPNCVILFFLFSGLRFLEALSGSRIAELTMQQPGKQKSYVECPGGLYYEQYTCFTYHPAAYPWRGTC